MLMVCDGGCIASGCSECQPDEASVRPEGGCTAETAEHAKGKTVATPYLTISSLPVTVLRHVAFDGEGLVKSARWVSNRCPATPPGCREKELAEVRQSILSV